MAINKNFVVKNGIEVNTNLIVADTDSNKVGIGTTVPEYTLHVFEGAGIGVTDITITGISTNLDELNVGVGGTTLTAISNATLGIGGSVGVGTDAPGYLLEVHSPVSSGQTALFVRGDMRVTGDINIDDISIGDLNVSGISTFVGNIIIGTAATVGFGSTAFFKDHAKAIFGDGEDLKVYHDGSNSYISDTGTGGLIVGSNSLTVKNAALNETQAVFTENGSVELYYDNAKRFETNAIGVEVSGTFNSTGITTLASSGGITTTGGDLFVGGDLYINEDIVLDTNLNILGIATVGSIHVTGISTFDGEIRGPNLTNSVLVGTGLSVRGATTGVAVTLAGAGGITTTGGDLFVGGDLHINEDVILDTNLTILGIATIGVLQVNNASGINTIFSTVQSSSKDTGALVIEGGVGIEKNLFVGGGAEVTGLTTITGVLDANNTTESSSSTTGAAKFAGGVGVAKNLFVGGGAEVTGLTTITGVLDANNTTQSTSSTTGSAKFAGGVGIEKQLYVGAGASVGAGFTIGTGIGVTTILDDDAFNNASATALASQQSIKAYVDSQVSGSDLDFQGDSGGALSVDLDSQTFTIAGTANEIETSGSGQTLTIGLPNNVTISGELDVTTLDVSGNADIDGHTELDNVNIAGFSTFASNILIGTGATVGFGSTAYFRDNAKAIFGDGEDLKIYHNGTDSYVQDAGTGSLILSGSRVIVKNAADNERMIDATENGAVELFFDNSKKFETGPAGTITVGVSTADGFEAGDDERIKLGADQDLQLYHDGANSWLINNTGDLSLRNLADDKDVLLQSDNGSGGFETYVQADGSTRAAKLFNSGSVKFETTSSGVIATGINTAGAVRITDNLTPVAGQGLELFCPDTSSSTIQSFDRTNGETDKLTLRGNPVELKDNSTIRLVTTGAGVTVTGICSASGGFDIGIHSAGTSVATGPIKILNFVGTGNTFAYTAGTDTIDISIAGGGGSGGVSETDTSVSSTSATGVGSFAVATHRSAAIIAQIDQGGSYQVGRYLMIHDGTTATVIEESAIATGDMLGSFSADINNSNAELKVTMNSSGIATVTTKIDTVTV